MKTMTIILNYLVNDFEKGFGLELHRSYIDSKSDDDYN